MSDRMANTLRFAIIFYTAFFVAFLLFWFVPQQEQQHRNPAHQVRSGEQHQNNSKLIIHLRIVPQGLSI